MDNLRIEGGVPLKGTLRISGAKNAALPILCASLLADGDSCFRNVPDLTDIRTTAKLLRHLGLDVEVEPPVVKVTGRPVGDPDAPYDLVRKMRASVLVLGPLTARYGKAR
ncbi:MAG: UDP-N-acetylglucosamine 1-carboxyvinyltransferase, partial [Sandaracinaceae bacterium]